MKKLFSFAAATLLVGAVAATSAFAADAPKKAAAKKPHHQMSCNDYAWESQAMKDCMAKASAKPAATKSHAKMNMKGM